MSLWLFQLVLVSYILTLKTLNVWLQSYCCQIKMNILVLKIRSDTVSVGNANLKSLNILNQSDLKILTNIKKLTLHRARGKTHSDHKMERFVNIGNIHLKKRTFVFCIIKIRKAAWLKLVLLGISSHGSRLHNVSSQILNSFHLNIYIKREKIKNHTYTVITACTIKLHVISHSTDAYIENVCNKQSCSVIANTSTH